MKRTSLPACTLLLFLLLCPLLQAQTKTLRVAAASDLQPVMPALAEAYLKQTGVKLQVSYGSSSALATQIVNGSPADVFLGADFTFPEKVVAAGLTAESAPVAYARGTLVLWARKDTSAQPPTVDLLSDPRVTRIAIADEFHAPYGRAAYAALRTLKIDDKVKGKLVIAENVSQAAQFVESGNAQIGFISLTLASSPHLQEVGTYVRVPKIYPEIRQCAVTLKKSLHAEDAKKFLAWLTSPKVQELLPPLGLSETN